MKARITLAAAVLVLAILAAAIAQSATLRIRFTLPDQDNVDSTCTAPILLPMGTNLALKGHWRWWIAGGDSLGGAIEDSLAGSPGTVVMRDYQVSQALFRVRVWAADLGGAGCDTLVSVRPFKFRPWKPRW